ncbi:hypothetical protein HDU67_000315 [Dinochytrium kinnereticum]|nr:hypothetical protein HDU67_000315 [Dinochytrium kinnereticum]
MTDVATPIVPVDSTVKPATAVAAEEVVVAAAATEETVAAAAAPAAEPTATTTPPPSVAEQVKKASPSKAFDIANDDAPGLYLTAADGMKVYYNVWKAEGVTPIAVVLAVHGLGEHIHRYDHVFSKYAEAGIVVKGLDYRGHGRTLKKNLPISRPGFLGSFELVWADVLAMNAIAVDGVPTGLPTFVVRFCFMPDPND